MQYKDNANNELFDGDLVMADETLLSGALGVNVPYGTLGVYCGSEDNKTAHVAWVGIGSRRHCQFNKLLLYEPKSLSRAMPESDE